MDKCVFDNCSGGCGALIEKNCEGCKFFKTEQQFDDAQKQSELILDRKELKPRIIRHGATQIMSVTKKAEKSEMTGAKGQQLTCYYVKHCPMFERGRK